MKVPLYLLLFLPTYILSNSSLFREEPILHISAIEGIANQSNEELEHDKLKGISPLHRACERGELALITMILQNSLIDINSQTLEGLTPLHYASGASNEEVVYILLDAGANPNIQDNNGQTPLHFSAIRENDKISQKLIDYGADATIKDNDGKNPRELHPLYRILMLQDSLFALSLLVPAVQNP